MRRYKPAIWLASLCYCLTCFVAVAQPAREQARKNAREILNSPKAIYLSEGGRNALQILAADESAEPSGRAQPAYADAAIAEMFTRIAPAANGEVMVNDPDQDRYTAQDATTQSQPSVAAHNGTVVVAYNDSGATQPFTYLSSIMGYSRSADAGATFVDMGSFPPPPFGGQNLGVPGMAASKAGHFYASAILYSNSFPYYGPTVGVYKSTDGGFTWPALAYVPPGTASPFAAVDKPFIAVDASPTRFQGNVYVSFTNATFLYPGLGIFVSRSTDGGISFQQPVLVSDPAQAGQGAEPATGPEGELYVTWLRMDTSPRMVMFTRSFDGGLTFEAPVAIAAVNQIGFETRVLGGGFRVNSYPRIDVNPVNGYIYVVYSSNPPGPDGSDIYMITSTNRGRTWSAPVRINTDVTLNDQYHPDVAVNSFGTLEVMWYDRRDDPSNTFINVYRARVFPTGQFVVSNEKVTSQAFPPALGYDPVIIPNYMGDYLDLRSGVNQLGRAAGFFAAWGDNRRQITTPGGRRNDQDVFFKRY